MQQIKVSTNATEIRKKLSLKRKKHLPNATMEAINRTAAGLRLHYQKQMDVRLDRPTNFTKNGIKFEKATLKNLSGSVFIMPIQEKYLEAQIEGGTYSKANGRDYMIPTKDAKLNDSGNWESRRKPTGGGKTIRRTKTGWGIYSKGTKNQPPKLLASFKSFINYKKRFDFYKLGLTFVRTKFNTNLDKSIKKEMNKK